MRKLEMDDRIITILCAVVDSYIETAEPVGSRTLSRHLDLDLSPATIRNVMADLTEMGFLEQPHTSAGRVPTDIAYRYYVDACLDDYQIPQSVQDDIERVYSQPVDGLKDMLISTTKLLADVTNFTGIVASPRVNSAKLRLIEFLRISDNKIYVVLITASNMVHHRIIEVSEGLDGDFLQKVSGYLNEHFANQSLEEVRIRMFESLKEEKELYDQLLAQAIRLSKKALDITDQRELYVEGQFYIVNEFAEVNQMEGVLKALEEKITIIDLLDQTLLGSGVNITIGLENQMVDLKNCTVVTARYGNMDTPLGSIGVIGPTRMNYNRIIPIIDYTAKMLSQAITNQ